jgi:hypothetical protein
MHLVPRVLAGLLVATGLAGAVIPAVTLDGVAGARPAVDLVPDAGSAARNGTFRDIARC